MFAVLVPIKGKEINNYVKVKQEVQEMRRWSHLFFKGFHS